MTSASFAPASSSAGVRTDGCIIASTSTLSHIFPRHHSPPRPPPNNVRPSLYHDPFSQDSVNAQAPQNGGSCSSSSNGSSSSSSLKPLFTRRISWLPSPNVLHYVPASLTASSKHLETFTRWHKIPRVEGGWQQAWSEEKQKDYLQEVQEGDGSLGLIGYWSTDEEELGEMWGYVEIYWAKESNLHPFYEFPEQTMGLHALVGEERFRGPSRVRAWMSSAVQMMFLLEPRCDLVVSEPRSSNTKMIDYECETGGQIEKEIQLPHKRAALVFWRKSSFETTWPLGDRSSLVPRQPSTPSANASLTTSVTASPAKLSSASSSSPSTAAAA